MVHRPMRGFLPISKGMIASAGLLLGTVFGASCGEQGAPRPVEGHRVASFSPAMTSMAIDLGLRGEIVGRTPFCRGLDETVPVVGSLLEVDPEMLLQVQPTIVLVQPTAHGVDPGLAALAAKHGFALVAIQIDGIDDISAAVSAIAEERGGEEVAAARDRIVASLAGLARTSSPNAPRVAVVYSIDPIGMAGTGTYLDSIVTAAGGRNAIRRNGWIELSAEELVAVAPEIVVVIGDDVGALPHLPWTAVPRFIAFDEPDAMEPSSRAPEVARSLAEALRSLGS